MSEFTATEWATFIASIIKRAEADGFLVQWSGCNEGLFVCERGEDDVYSEVKW